jgi:hypothetical protein
MIILDFLIADCGFRRALKPATGQSEIERRANLRDLGEMKTSFGGSALLLIL